ncbi:hypothetical protein BHE74_00058879 [Ensete ventricosum]|nr:hypothetical protein BHE74_00058879 [Ensete ventricosum]
MNLLTLPSSFAHSHTVSSAPLAMLVSQRSYHLFPLRKVDYRRGKRVILVSPPTFQLPNLPYPFNRSTHLSLPNTANSDLLLPSSLVAASNDPYDKKLPEEVKARQLYTLKTAISFTRHQEEQLKYEARKTRVAPQLATPKLSPPPTVSRPSQPQKLIKEDLHDRSTKGLCGCCNKLWSLEHKCSKEIPLMITPIEEPKLKDMTLESEDKDMKEKLQSVACTFHAPLQILDINDFIKHQPLNQLWFLIQCSLISGYFHDFTEERTMMLKVFPDDDLGSTAHDRKKEQEKGIHMTPTTMMSSISMLALYERDNVFVLGVGTSRVRIDVTLIQDG